MCGWDRLKKLREVKRLSEVGETVKKKRSLWGIQKSRHRKNGCQGRGKREKVKEPNEK